MFKWILLANSDYSQERSQGWSWFEDCEGVTKKALANVKKGIQKLGGRESDIIVMKNKNADALNKLFADLKQEIISYKKGKLDLFCFVYYIGYGSVA